MFGLALQRSQKQATAPPAVRAFLALQRLAGLVALTLVHTAERAEYTIQEEGGDPAKQGSSALLRTWYLVCQTCN